MEQWIKAAFYFKLKKETESSDGDLTYQVFSLESAVVHLEVRNPSGILAVET